jgi:P27 family predicted phage terminase small subunit
MSGRGRPRQPDELKILRGTFRADRDGDPAEAVPASGAPKPPTHLKGDGLKFWKQVVPGLVESGVAKACDAPALAMMCEWWARYRKLSMLLDEDAPENNPVAQVLKEKQEYQRLVMLGIAWTNFDKVAARFGLTPSDRAKLRLGGEKKKAGVPSRRRQA